MEQRAEPVGAVVVLGQSRLWPGLLVPVAGVLVLVLVAVLAGWTPWYLFVAPGVALAIAVTQRRTAILADDAGLLVRDRHGLRRSYAWTGIERMGWRHMGSWGSALEVYPRGGPYDVPGPNASTDVGHIWGPRRPRGGDPLPALLRRHGVRSLLDD